MSAYEKGKGTSLCEVFSVNLAPFCRKSELTQVHRTYN